MYDVSGQSPDEYRLRRAYIRAAKTGEPIPEILCIFDGAGRERGWEHEEYEHYGAYGECGAYGEDATGVTDAEPEAWFLRAVEDQGAADVTGAADEAGEAAEAGDGAAGDGAAGAADAPAEQSSPPLADVLPFDRALRSRR